MYHFVHGTRDKSPEKIIIHFLEKSINYFIAFQFMELEKTKTRNS